MKKGAALAIAMLVATPSFAGGPAPVIVEPAVIVEDSSSSSAGSFIVPLLGLLVLACVASPNC